MESKKIPFEFLTIKMYYSCLILDEADRLLDMGYEKDVAAIVKAIEDHKKAATYDPMALVKQTVKKNISEEEEAEKNDLKEENPVKHHLTEVFLSKQRQTILLSATLTKVLKLRAFFSNIIAELYI